MSLQTAAAARQRAEETAGAAGADDGQAPEVGADDDRPPTLMPAPPAGKARAAAAAAKDDGLLQERTEVLRNLTATMANIANREPRTRHQIWADLLAINVVDVPEEIREQVKHQIDGIILDAKAGRWQPPN